MDKVIQLCYCKVSLYDERKISATQLRSFIGYMFFEDVEFHHHDTNPYRYPLIQYKRINDELCVLGIQQFSDLVFDRISGLQYITMHNTKIPISNIVFERKKHTITDKLCQYRFESPWIALNAENYAKFKSLDPIFYQKFLEDILTGNLLSTLKGLDMMIDFRLYVKINWFKHVPVVAHKHGFSGFYADFITNLSLPDFIGLGKSASKGFGMIRSKSTIKSGIAIKEKVH